MNMSDLRLRDDVLTGSLAITNDKINASNSCLPIVTLEKNKDTIAIPEWGNEHIQLGAAIHAPGTYFNRFDFSVSSEVVKLKEYGEEAPLPIEYPQVADQNLRIESAYARGVESRMFVQKEYIATGLMADSTNYGSTHSPAIKWDAAGSIALTDMNTGFDYIVNTIGMEPNLVIFSRNAYRAFIVSDQFVAKLKTSEIVSVELVASILGVDKVVIGKGVYDDAGTITQMYDEWVGIYYVTPVPSDMMMTWGYCFQKYNYPVIERYNSDERRSVIMRYVNWYRHAVIKKEAGYLITNTLT